MRANALMKHNIDTLLRVRGQSRRDLAQWCRRTDAWISQIFKEDRREIPLKYVDRIADFFGIAAYQLFQPGISRLTERRSGLERRQARERRISQALAPDAPPASPQVQPDEWAHLSKRRKLTAEERVRLDHAADVLLLSQDVEATRGKSGKRPGTTPAGSPPPPRVRKRKSAGARGDGLPG